MSATPFISLSNIPPLHLIPLISLSLLRHLHKPVVTVLTVLPRKETTHHDHRTPQVSETCLPLLPYKLWDYRNEPRYQCSCQIKATEG